jgi:hypothetical protein
VSGLAWIRLKNMKKTKIDKIFYLRLFSLLSIMFLLNSTAASYPFYYQQTTQIRKSKKVKKRVVKKAVNKKKSTIVSEGTWGGTGIGFVIGKSGVQIEYDCAVGAINQTLVIDENGNFDINGLHKYTPKMIRVDIVPKPQTAKFQGKISGSTMKLKVVLTETREVVGEYTLTRDKEPFIRKCR